MAEAKWQKAKKKSPQMNVCGLFFNDALLKPNNFLLAHQDTSRHSLIY
jgi:hypothetical protein